MLQWLGPDFGRRILYNDIRDGHYRSVVYDLETGAEQVLPMAAYTVSSDGKWALCVDYDRLYWYRPGYNYQGSPRPEKSRSPKATSSGEVGPSRSATRRKTKS